jgi:hypothetical protein
MKMIMNDDDDDDDDGIEMGQKNYISFAPIGKRGKIERLFGNSRRC